MSARDGGAEVEREALRGDDERGDDERGDDERGELGRRAAGVRAPVLGEALAAAEGGANGEIGRVAQSGEGGLLGTYRARLI
jgi:hypothetical protein